MRTVNKLFWVSLAVISLASLVFGCGGGGNNRLIQPQNAFTQNDDIPLTKEENAKFKQVFGVAPSEIESLPLDELIEKQQIIVQKREELTKSHTRGAVLYYNRAGAARYALDWTLEGQEKRNLNYRKWSLDCTNFVSQSIHEGGEIPFVWGPTWKLLNRLTWFWWYKDSGGSVDQDTCSYSWNNANNFFFFACYWLGEIKSNVSQLEVGDCISLDFEGNGRKDHTVFVTSKDDNGQPRISAHTSDHHDLGWNEFSRNLGSTQIYPIHIISLFSIDAIQTIVEQLIIPDDTSTDVDIEVDPNDAPPPPDDGSTGGSGSSTTPDTTPPNVLTAGCRVEPIGNGRFIIAVAFDAPDFNSGYLQLEGSDGVRHGIGGQNWTNPIILEHNMTGWPYGVYKVMTWAKDNTGNASPLMDTSLRIGWGAPWIEDQSMEGPSSTGQSVYRAKLDSFSGHDGVSWSELFYWIGDRYYQIGSRINGWQAEWNINPLDYANLEKDKVYPLTLIVMGTNGVKADMIPAGYYLTVPNVVIPLERGKESLVKYEPAGVPWHWENKYLAITGWHGPYGPSNFNVNLTIYVEGTQHHSSTEHCPVVYGFRNNSNSYKVMGAWGYGYWMRFYGNVADLPTGLHCIGAEMRLDGRITGPIRAKDSWIWVDNDHPKFDKIIEGPTSGSMIRKSQSTELCIRTTMQDPGGSGTAEYWLALVGQGEERGFKERIYGYTGINHCAITGLPNGQYGLFITYSRDQVDNLQTRSIATDVTFQIAD